MTNEITIPRGDTRTITITVTDDSTGLVYNLTGYTMRFTVKENASDPDTLAKIGPVTCTITTPATGIGTVSLTKVQTALPSRTYVYDVQITSASDNFTVITPTSFIITDDVTKVS